MNNKIHSAPLTAHFNLSEFIHSVTASQRSINNDLPEEYFDRIRGLALILEHVRSLIDDKIIITSGYRCPALNRLVGGARNSKHTLGVAVDFTFGDFHLKCGIVARALKLSFNCHFVKVYGDRNFIHVDFPISYLESLSHDN